MKTTTKTLAFALLLGVCMTSCSLVEGVVGGSEGEASSFGGIIDSLWGLLKGFLPSLAAWEGFGSIFSPRKRQHYGKMVMAVVPLNNNNVEFGEAVKALGSGLGLAHSSDATKATHDKEVSNEKEKALKKEKA